MQRGQLGILAALSVCLALTAVAVAAEPVKPSPEALRETLVLKNGNKIVGEVLKEKADVLVVDLGFSVVSVPMNAIETRTAGPNEKPDESSEKSGDLYRIAHGKLRERPVKELAAVLGKSVTLVSTPGGMGSGFVVDARGYVVTNAHVIQGEQEVSVTLFRKVDGALDRVKLDNVKIVAENPFLDLALLKVEAPEGMALKEVLVGADAAARDGQGVFAIGNPLGLERTVSEGIISSARRSFDGQVYIQTTAPINPGNSGGPLFNLRGEVIGVTNMKVGFFTEGLGFAIPIRTLKFFLRNRDVFAFDKDNPNTGYHYLAPPRKTTGDM